MVFFNTWISPFTFISRFINCKKNHLFQCLKKTDTMFQTTTGWLRILNGLRKPAGRRLIVYCTRNPSTSGTIYIIYYTYIGIYYVLLHKEQYKIIIKNIIRVTGVPTVRSATCSCMCLYIHLIFICLIKTRSV